MEYSVRINRRAKRMIVTIYPDGQVIITTPRATRPETIERFLKNKEAWILKTQEKLRKRHVRQPLARMKHSPEQIAAFKKEALTLATTRLTHFNTHYKLPYKKISIRNQKTRWGSCSRSGTLSFNYRIACMSPELADYIIVHELCHVQHMNHSPRFWKLVAETIPDYVARRKALRAV